MAPSPAARVERECRDSYLCGDACGPGGEPAADAARAALDRRSLLSAAVIEAARPDRDAIEPAPAGPAAPTQQGEIFKSGVLDGMAYMLHTEDAIAAELAKRTVKFASIDELRAYLAAHEP
jgi:hypothetical protein